MQLTQPPLTLQMAHRNRFVGAAPRLWAIKEPMPGTEGSEAGQRANRVVQPESQGP
jgi:hypothetical protein